MADECENLCRLCIDGGGEAVIDIDGRVGERINSCLPVKVDSSDDLPHRICKPCLHKVDTFYEFTNTCRESERRLIHMIRGEGAATSPSKTSNSLDRTATFVKQEEVDVVVGGSSGGGSFLQKEEEDPDESKSYLFQQRFVEEDESVSLNATSRTGPDNDDDEDEDEEEQPPPPKRAKRTAALKAAIALDQNSDDDLDDDLGEAHTKTEDQTDDSDDNFLVMPSTSGAEGVNAADQPGPSTAVPAASAGRSTSGPGTGADPVEAPSRPPREVEVVRGERILTTAPESSRTVTKVMPKTKPEWVQSPTWPRVVRAPQSKFHDSLIAIPPRNRSPKLKTSKLISIKKNQFSAKYRNSITQRTAPTFRLIPVTPSKIISDLKGTPRVVPSKRTSGSSQVSTAAETTPRSSQTITLTKTSSGLTRITIKSPNSAEEKIVSKSRQTPITTSSKTRPESDGTPRITTIASNATHDPKKTLPSSTATPELKRTLTKGSSLTLSKTNSRSDRIPIIASDCAAQKTKAISETKATPVSGPTVGTLISPKINPGLNRIVIKPSNCSVQKTATLSRRARITIPSKTSSESEGTPRATAISIPSKIPSDLSHTVTAPKTAPESSRSGSTVNRIVITTPISGVQKAGAESGQTAIPTSSKSRTPISISSETASDSSHAVTAPTTTTTTLESRGTVAAVRTSSMSNRTPTAQRTAVRLPQTKITTSSKTSSQSGTIAVSSHDPASTVTAPKSTRSTAYIVKALLNKDSPTAPFYCLTCAVNFKDSSEAKLHTPSTNLKCRYFCQLCSNYMATLSALDVHMENHVICKMKKKEETADSKHSCDFCEKSQSNTSVKEDLSQQQRLVHDMKTKMMRKLRRIIPETASRPPPSAIDKTEGAKVAPQVIADLVAPAGGRDNSFRFDPAKPWRLSTALSMETAPSADLDVVVAWKPAGGPSEPVHLGNISELYENAVERTKRAGGVISVRNIKELLEPKSPPPPPQSGEVDATKPKTPKRLPKKCDSCSAVFGRMRSFRSHEQRKRKCSLCGFMCCWLRDMRGHYMAEHGAYFCKKCDFTCKRRWTMTEHVNEAH